METSKKILDENGLTTLWNQIENNFISTDNIEAIISAIDAIKADKESPEFTGVPTAPTANPNTNTTQIATTEFVNTAIAAGYVNPVTASASMTIPVGIDENRNLFADKDPDISVLELRLTALEATIKEI